MESAKELAPKQAIVLLNKFRAKGWRPRGKAKGKGQGAKGNYIEIKPGPAAPQQRKVLALWAALGYEVAKLHARCKRQFGIERFEWVTDGNHLHILITDLEARLRRL